MLKLANSQVALLQQSLRVSLLAPTDAQDRTTTCVYEGENAGVNKHYICAHISIEIKFDQAGGLRKSLAIVVIGRSNTKSGWQVVTQLRLDHMRTQQVNANDGIRCWGCVPSMLLAIQGSIEIRPATDAAAAWHTLLQSEAQSFTAAALLTTIGLEPAFHSGHFTCRAWGHMHSTGVTNKALQAQNKSQQQAREQGQLGRESHLVKGRLVFLVALLASSCLCLSSGCSSNCRGRLFDCWLLDLRGYLLETSLQTQSLLHQHVHTGTGLPLL